MATEIIDGIEVDLDRMPDQFDDLKTVIREWVKSDDAEREHAQEAAATEELQSLWIAVQPHFGAINEYLDEQAHLLGSLAEGAMEAAFEIERRTGTNPMS